MLNVVEVEAGSLTVRAAYSADLGRIVAVPDLCRALGVTDAQNVVRLGVPRFGDFFAVAGEAEVPFVQVAFIGVIGERIPSTMPEVERLFHVVHDTLDDFGAPPMPTCSSDELDSASEGEAHIIGGHRLHLITRPGDDRTWFLESEIVRLLEPLDAARAQTVLVAPDRASTLVATMGGIEGEAVVNEAALRRLAMISRNPEAQALVRSILDGADGRGR
jgi:prophage antirepressor-like protein